MQKTLNTCRARNVLQLLFCTVQYELKKRVYYRYRVYCNMCIWYNKILPANIRQQFNIMLVDIDAVIVGYSVSLTRPNYRHWRLLSHNHMRSWWSWSSLSITSKFTGRASTRRLRNHMKQPRRHATATPYEQYDLTRGPVNEGVFTLVWLELPPSWPRHGAVITGNLFVSSLISLIMIHC